MDSEREFYLCASCFEITEVKKEHHRRPMFHYRGFRAGDVQIKPLLDTGGNLKTRAPRWFVEKRWPHALGPKGMQEH